MKNSSPEIVSIVVFNSIKENFQLEYENWQSRIGEKIKEFNGFIGISNKKLEGITNEYFTIFQFDTSYNLSKWQNSDILKEYLNELKQYSISESKVSQHDGLEIFFGKTETATQSTPFYKKVVLGVIAVYPLIIVVGKLYDWLNPWAEKIPFEIGLFFQVIVISALMTYPVMPTLAKILHKWLTN
ncbi:MAG: hypothetical protein V7719_02920 [Psychroserpens sp.]|uniref:hypothetical protein n=1 Tax=Psychroserpens sp. TaxID=2020870 RepID=UPI0030013542